MSKETSLVIQHLTVVLEKYMMTMGRIEATRTYNDFLSCSNGVIRGGANIAYNSIEMCDVSCDAHSGALRRHTLNVLGNYLKSESDEQFANELGLSAMYPHIQSEGFELPSAGIPVVETDIDTAPLGTHAVTNPFGNPVGTYDITPLETDANTPPETEPIGIVVAEAFTDADVLSGINEPVFDEGEELKAGFASIYAIGVDVANGVDETVTYPFGKPIVETFIEPVAETIIDPVVETIIDPIVETIIEPVAETLAEPVAETLAEPVAEIIIEPVAETLAEPVAETLAEPVAETLAEPVAETLAEPVAENIDPNHTLNQMMSGDAVVTLTPAEEPTVTKKPRVKK